jgi:hypothetical protein
MSAEVAGFDPGPPDSVAALIQVAFAPSRPSARLAERRMTDAVFGFVVWLCPSGSLLELEETPLAGDGVGKRADHSQNIRKRSRNAQCELQHELWIGPA